MSIEVSSVALLRIAKHCFASESSIVSGCLLGLDNDEGEVQVTNVFVHPAKGAADFQPQQAEDTQAENTFVSAAGSFQLDSLRLLKSANTDANIVGWFQSSNFSSFVNEATADIQFDYQSTNPNSVMLVADAAFGEKAPIRAFRLTGEYLTFHKALRERKMQGPATLVTGGPVTFDLVKHRVFEEVPIKISLSVLDEAYLFENRNQIAQPHVEKIQEPTNLIQQLMEVVEDVAIEKVRFANLEKEKPGPTTGATRIRGGEEETKRIQAGSDLILLTENARRLCEHLQNSAQDTLHLCKLYEAAAATRA